MPPKTAVKPTKPQGKVKTPAAKSSGKTNQTYSTSSLPYAASAPKFNHLPAIPELRRTNSMSQTHAEEGGVRSTARLSRAGCRPLYTSLYYTGEAEPPDLGKVKHPKYRAFPANKVDEDSKLDEKQLSKRDAEVSVIHDLGKSSFLNYLFEMKKGEVAELEFHGNVGPCNGCKVRIEDAIKFLSGKMYKDTTLKVCVYYQRETYETERGDNNVRTFYGYIEGVTKVTYNADPLYCKELGTFQGSVNRKAVEKLAAAKASASSSSKSATTNAFDLLRDESDDADESSDESN
jgi:hypothetical protein